MLILLRATIQPFLTFTAKNVYNTGVSEKNLAKFKSNPNSKIPTNLTDTWGGGGTLEVANQVAGVTLATPASGSCHVYIVICGWTRLSGLS